MNFTWVIRWIVAMAVCYFIGLLLDNRRREQIRQERQRQGGKPISPSYKILPVAMFVVLTAACFCGAVLSLIYEITFSFFFHPAP